jgi:hypothetical protein
VGRQYRWRRGNVLGVAICLVGAVGFTFMANDSASGPDTSSYTDGDGIAGLLLAGIWLMLAVRSWRAGLATTEDAVTIRNVLWTTTVPWNLIQAFEVVSHRGFPDARVLGVCLRSGRVIRVSALGGENPSGLGRRRRRALDGFIVELNDELQRHGTDTGSGAIHRREAPRQPHRATRAQAGEPVGEGHSFRWAVDVLFTLLAAALLFGEWVLEGEPPWRGFDPVLLVLSVALWLAVRTALWRQQSQGQVDG